MKGVPDMRNNKDRYNWIYDSTKSVRQAKEKSIHEMAAFGRKHKYLKWPVCVLLILFIFVYNFLYYLFINLHIRERFSRALALAMTVILVVSGIDFTAFAMRTSEMGESSIEVIDVESGFGDIVVPYGTEQCAINFPKTIDVTVVENSMAVDVVEETAEAAASDNTAASDNEAAENPAVTEEVSENEIAAEVAESEEETAAFDENSEMTAEETIFGEEAAQENGAITDNSEASEQEAAAAIIEAGRDKAQEEAAVAQYTEETNEEPSAPQVSDEKDYETIEDEDIPEAAPAMVFEEVTEGITEDTEAAEEPQEAAAEESVTEEMQPVTEEAQQPETVVSEPKKITMPVEWSTDYYNAYAAGTYVFKASLPGEYEGKPVNIGNVSLPTVTVEVMETGSTRLETVVSDVKIVLDADPGVFGDGVSLYAAVVADETILNDTTDKVDEVRDDAKSVVARYAFDIKVLDMAGNEVQPDNSKGRVRISFEMAGCANANLETDIYHIHDNQPAETIDTTVTDDVASGSVESFSYYIVELSYDTKVYTFDNNEAVGLSQIMAVCNIVGTPSAVTVSNSEYLQAAWSEEMGDWLVRSIASLTTPETITVTVDGVDYVINVSTRSGEPVTLGNNGYAYGMNMSTSSITLACDVTAGTPVSYQWYVSDDKDGAYSPVENATESTYTFSPNADKWYFCRVNNVTDTIPIWVMNSGGSSFTGKCSSFNYYISNGRLAYAVKSSKLDVVGYYVKNGHSYWLQTSFGGGGWDIATRGSGSGVNKVRAFFSPTDDYSLQFAMTLNQGVTDVAFGCDTMLGSYNITNYSDTAALIANIDRGKLYQIVMIGNASQEAATDTDPAFVIRPITTDGLRFWIGNYGGRTNFAYNTRSDGYQYITEELNGETVTTQVINGVDSGMTMSWLGVPEGKEVGFQFSVGSVANTGAKTTANTVVTSRKVVVKRPDQGFYYALYKKNADGTQTKVTDWQLVDGEIEEIVYDNLEPDTEYTVKIVDATVFNPVTEEGIDQGTDTDITTAIDPMEETEGQPEPVVTVTRNTITINNLNPEYSYQLKSEMGENSDFIAPVGGKVEFKELCSGTTYKLIAKSPTNELSDAVEITTLDCEDCGGHIAVDALTDADFEWNHTEDGEFTCNAIIRCKYNSEHVVNVLPCTITYREGVTPYDIYDGGANTYVHYLTVDATASIKYKGQTYTSTISEIYDEEEHTYELLYDKGEVFDCQIYKCKECGTLFIYDEESGEFDVLSLGVATCIYNEEDVIGDQAKLQKVVKLFDKLYQEEMDIFNLEAQIAIQEGYVSEQEVEAYRAMMEEEYAPILEYVDYLRSLIKKGSSSGPDSRDAGKPVPNPAEILPVPVENNPIEELEEKIEQEEEKPVIKENEKAITEQEVTATDDADNVINTPIADSDSNRNTIDWIARRGGTAMPDGRDVIEVREAEGKAVEKNSVMAIGNGSVGIEIDSNIGGGLGNAGDIEAAILTGEELELVRNGVNINLILEVTDNEVTGNDIMKSAVKALLAEGDAAVCSDTFNVSLTKQIGNNMAEVISRTDSKVGIRVLVPENLSSDNAVYCIVDNEGNVYEASVEEGEDGLYLNFETDNFENEYSIVMISDEDTALAAGTDNDSVIKGVSRPRFKTGKAQADEPDKEFPVAVAGLAGISLLLFAFIITYLMVKRREDNNKQN